jgi:hypothetical protein
LLISFFDSDSFVIKSQATDSYSPSDISGDFISPYGLCRLCLVLKYISQAAIYSRIFSNILGSWILVFFILLSICVTFLCPAVVLSWKSLIISDTDLFV